MSVIPFEALRQAISGELHTDLLRRYMLATDGSIFQKIPAAVVYPASTADVSETIRFANAHGISVHARGSGSGLCGAAVGDGIVLDFSKFMNRLIDLDTEDKSFICEPGYRFGELAERLSGSGLFFPPDPSSGEYASFGGMCATNASGAHSVKYGNTADYLIDAEIVFGDGSVHTLSGIRDTPMERLSEPFRALHSLYTDNAAKIESAYPPLRFNVAGYNLRGLITEKGRLDLRRLISGAEGTLAVVTRLTFRLLDKPKHDSLVVAFMDDIVASARAVQAVLPLGPSGIEIMDKSLLELAKSHDPRLRKAIPDGVDNVLLIEFDGFDPDECAASAEKAMALVRESGAVRSVAVAVSQAEKAAFWAVRKAAVPILYKLKGEKKILALIEDAAVPTDRLVDYFEGIYEILNRHGVRFVTYGHIAKGLLHTRPMLNLKDGHDVALLRTLDDEMFELVHGLGGSVSGEHGDGRLRSAYIERQYPEIYPLFREVKRLLDPENRLNPEIITRHDPDQMQHDLRYGAAYRRHDLGETLFNWPEGFAREVEKCHGCSKCTTVTSANRMCPLFKITRDESAAPKAKANLLRALISGAVDDRYLYDRVFQYVIDRCANCGSCAMECPSNVNIPKLAMEARARYAERYGVKPTHRLLGEVERLGRLMRPFSAMISPVMDLPVYRRAGEVVAGIARERPFIRFPARSLNRRIPGDSGDGDITVLYFAGCYASLIEPKIGEALVRVLRHMGMRVLTPEQHCCGLPMLAKGMIPEAREKVATNLRRWERLIDSADFITVSCSSCGYALMKDWAYLIDDGRTQRVREKVIHVTDLIGRYKERLRLKNGNARKLAYHAPCHLRIQPNPGASLNLLSGLAGVDITDLKSNCCGIIGSWGMTAENYDLSRAIAGDMVEKLNRSGAAAGVTDCPTCRMQMLHFTDLPVLHPVEVVVKSLAD